MQIGGVDRAQQARVLLVAAVIEARVSALLTTTVPSNIFTIQIFNEYMVPVSSQLRGECSGSGRALATNRSPRVRCTTV